MNKSLLKQIGESAYAKQKISNGFSPEAESEVVLHKGIRKYCESIGAICFSGRMDKRSGRDPGEPDFHIYLDGKYWLVEVKTANGELSPIQVRKHSELLEKGFRVYVIRNIPAIKALLNEPGSNFWE